MLINLVFESGGIKGLSYVGAIKYFESRGFKVYSASGCSVGAIFASLVMCGYKANEIEQIIDEFDITELLKPNSIKDGFKKGGVYNISGLETKIAKILEAKGFKTFLDFKKGEEYLLKIVTTDSKTKKTVILPDELNKYGFSKDQFSVAKAIVMSCSIPFVYSKYQCDKYRFVDGGATYRFPLDIVNHKFPTYGLKLSNEFPFIEKVCKVMYSKRNNDLDVIKKCEIIHIDTYEIKGIQFNKGYRLKKELYRAGYVACMRYFNRKNQ